MKYIVFEGLDGSGKTTQAKKLCSFLRYKGLRCEYRHIFSSKAGNMIRDIFINNEFSNTVEILLLCASRIAFFDEIEEKKELLDIVILDRFYLSILAMQGQEKDDVDLIKHIKKNTVSENDVFYTFFLNTTPSKCMERLDKRHEIDRIERKGIDFHKKIYDRYLDLICEDDNLYVFDGNQDVQSVQNSIQRKVIEII